MTETTPFVEKVKAAAAGNQPALDTLAQSRVDDWVSNLDAIESALAVTQQTPLDVRLRFEKVLNLRIVKEVVGQLAEPGGDAVRARKLANRQSWSEVLEARLHELGFPTGKAAGLLPPQSLLARQPWSLHGHRGVPEDAVAEVDAEIDALEQHTGIEIARSGASILRAWRSMSLENALEQPARRLVKLLDGSDVETLKKVLLSVESLDALDCPSKWARQYRALLKEKEEARDDEESPIYRGKTAGAPDPVNLIALLDETELPPNAALGEVLPITTLAKARSSHEEVHRLFLIAERPGDQLWLIGILEWPESNAEGSWVSDPNQATVRDISSLRKKLGLGPRGAQWLEPGRLHTLEHKRAELLVERFDAPIDVAPSAQVFRRKR